jgi:hypothetical protein
MALPVMDAVVRAGREFVHLDDPILDAIEDVISPGHWRHRFPTPHGEPTS